MLCVRHLHNAEEYIATPVSWFARQSNNDRSPAVCCKSGGSMLCGSSWFQYKSLFLYCISVVARGMGVHRSFRACLRNIAYLRFLPAEKLKLTSGLVHRCLCHDNQCTSGWRGFPREFACSRVFVWRHVIRPV